MQISSARQIELFKLENKSRCYLGNDATLLESLIANQITNEDFIGEFDPGSGRTLAACLIHASRADFHLRVKVSGGRVSNT
jgi:hypothetical protein